jgi:hypothetical protein
VRDENGHHILPDEENESNCLRGKNGPGAKPAQLRPAFMESSTAACPVSVPANKGGAGKYGCSRNVAARLDSDA